MYTITLLGAASRVRLITYADHIRAFAERFPDYWWIIALADIKMRQLDGAPRRENQVGKASAKPRGVLRKISGYMPFLLCTRRGRFTDTKCIVLSAFSGWECMRLFT